ncbi:MAG: HD domain-containing protein [Verrucomicrobiota bacterium]
MMTLRELREKAEAGYDDELSAYAQITQLRKGATQNGKPFFDLDLADSTDKASIKIWSATPAFAFLEKAKTSDAIELTGLFHVNQYGLNVNQPSARFLSATEKEELFAGSEEQKQRSDADWKFLKEICSSLDEPCLRAICELALEKYEKKWLRAAAARNYHHARRGGLLEHTSQMLRCAQALAPLYKEISPALLYAGVLFHDIGKLWENDYEEQGFTSPYNRTGELMGHISLGVEVANQLWREAEQKNPEIFQNAKSAELIRQHLLHLIISHHGELEFGSPITPRTPEAWMLHHIDNIDAKIEMLRLAYAEKPQLAPGIFEARRPLTGSVALPLSCVLAPQPVESAPILRNEIPI